MNNSVTLLKNNDYLGLNQIINDCQKGSIKAFEELYKMYSSRMYNIAFRMHGNEDDAADSLQDAFIKVYKNINSFKFESSFSTWFYRILVNTCLDNLKKNKRRSNEPIELYENKLSVVQKNNLNYDIIEKEISQLPPAYKIVFILYEIEGFNHQEISGILGISIGSSKSNLHRAKGILKTKLSGYFKENSSE